MQLFALDEGSLVFANLAAKQKNYLCCECNGTIRLRKGLHRQPHFFHLQPTRNCRLNGKGMIHLQVQMHLLNILPDGECILEHRFPSIQRIADVAWVPHKLIFEIQCSSITAEEIAQRNADYQKLGWQVVWILHDHRYNHVKVTAAESILHSCPHYFTNINQDGQGIIYDQLSLVIEGVRKHSIRSSAVDLASYQALPDHYPTLPLPILLKERGNAWPYHFKGDLFDKLNDPAGMDELSHFAQQTAAPTRCLLSRVKSFFTTMLIKPYKLFFQLLLEKQCR